MFKFCILSINKLDFLINNYKFEELDGVIIVC